MSDTKITSQAALLRAVRDRIRGQLDYKSEAAKIERDHRVPFGADSVFIAVQSGGESPAPTNDTNPTSKDRYFGVKVSVVMRVAEIARDRRDSLDDAGRDDIYESYSQSIRRRLMAIDELIDFNYDLMANANQVLSDNGDSDQGFIEPLRFRKMDDDAREADASLYVGSQHGRGDEALVMSAWWGGARRLFPR